MFCKIASTLLPVVTTMAVVTTTAAFLFSQKFAKLQGLSGWGGQMFIASLVFQDFSKGRLKTI